MQNRRKDDDRRALLDRRTWQDPTYRGPNRRTTSDRRSGLDRRSD